MLSVISGLLLIFMCICCGPNWRNKVFDKNSLIGHKSMLLAINIILQMVLWCKRRCGVIQFVERDYPKLSKSKSERDENLLLLIPEQIPGMILLINNSFICGVGLALIGLAIYGMVDGFLSAAAIPFIAIGISIVIISAFGMVGGVKIARGPSCCTIMFFYICMSALLGILWFLMYSLIFPGKAEMLVD